jgi:hypothetical protein
LNYLFQFVEAENTNNWEPQLQVSIL